MFSSLATHVSTKQNRCSCIYTLYSIQCFQCLHDLARLKIALNILAHVPKSLLDPGLGFLSDQALIAAQAHARGLYLVQRGNREQRYCVCYQ